jgi:large subunit ribosomal protein L4
LVIIGGENTHLQKSAQNLPEVKVLRTTGINLFDLLNYDQLVLTKDSIPYIERVYG